MHNFHKTENICTPVQDRPSTQGIHISVMARAAFISSSIDTGSNTQTYHHSAGFGFVADYNGWAPSLPGRSGREQRHSCRVDLMPSVYHKQKLARAFFLEINKEKNGLRFSFGFSSSLGTTPPGSSLAMHLIVLIQYSTYYPHTFLLFFHRGGGGSYHYGRKLDICDTKDSTQKHWKNLISDWWGLLL